MTQQINEPKSEVGFILPSFRTFDSKPTDKFPEIHKFYSFNFLSLETGDVSPIVVREDKLEQTGLQQIMDAKSFSDFSQEKIEAFKVLWDYNESGRNLYVKFSFAEPAGLTFSFKQVK